MLTFWSIFAFISISLACKLEWDILDEFGEETTLAGSEFFLKLSCTGDDPSKFSIQMSYRRGRKEKHEDITDEPKIDATTAVWELPLKKWLGYRATCVCSEDDSASNTPKINYILCNKTECDKCMKSRGTNLMGLCYFDSKKVKHCAQYLSEHLCSWQGRPKLPNFDSVCAIDDKGTVSNEPDLCALMSHSSNGHVRAIADITDDAKCKQASQWLTLNISGHEAYEYGKTYYISSKESLKFTAMDCTVADSGTSCQKREVGSRIDHRITGDCNSNWVIQAKEIDKHAKISCSFTENSEKWMAQLVFYVKKVVKKEGVLHNLTCLGGQPKCFWKDGTETLAKYTTAVEGAEITCTYKQYGSGCEPNLHKTVIGTSSAKEHFPKACVEQRIAIARARKSLTTGQIVVITVFCTFIGLLLIGGLAFVGYKYYTERKKGGVDLKKDPKPSLATDIPLDTTDWSYKNTIDIRL